MHSNGCLGCSFCDVEFKHEEEQYQLLKEKRQGKSLTVKLEYFFVKAFAPEKIEKGIY